MPLRTSRVASLDRTFAHAASDECLSRTAPDRAHAADIGVIAAEGDQRMHNQVIPYNEKKHILGFLKIRSDFLSLRN